MVVIKSKDQALEKLGKLPDSVLFRIAELSENPRALGYFESGFQFAILKSFLK